MKAEFGQNREFKQVYGTPPPGQFALEAEAGKSCYWDRCREQFAPKWEPKHEGFFFSHEPGQSENVAGFICKTEVILDLESLKAQWKKTTYSATDRDTILWVGPSMFWRECEMRRSLFTILLRCGMKYNPDKDDYEEALFGSKYGPITPDQEYAVQTAHAVKRFLFGFTRFVKVPGTPEGSSTFYNKTGWRETFKGREVDQIRQMLVWPEGEERFTTLIGLDSIWA